MPLTVGHSRSTRATRGPHHLDSMPPIGFMVPGSITLELLEASRGFFPKVLKPDWRLSQRSFRLARPGRGLSCASAGPEAHHCQKNSRTADRRQIAVQGLLFHDVQDASGRRQVVRDSGNESTTTEDIPGYPRISDDISGYRTISTTHFIFQESFERT